MPTRIRKHPVSMGAKVSAAQTLAPRRVVMLVSNPCWNDTRVIRAAEAVSRQGFEIVVLALSDQEKSTEEHRNGVVYRRLANPFIVGPPRWAPKNPLTSISGFDLARALLGHELPLGRSSNSEARESKVFGRLAISKAIGWRLLMRTAILSEVFVGRVVLRPFRPFLNARRMKRLFEKEIIRLNPQIIHAHDLVTLPAGGSAADKSGSKLIYDSHELELHRNTRAGPIARWLHAYLERKYIQQCDAVVTVCDSIADHLAQEYGVERPYVVMNAPDREMAVKSETDIRSLLGLSTDNPLAVYVGRITVGRGIEQSVKALQYISGYHLALVGPTHAPTVEDVRTLAQSLGVSDRVHILSPVSPGAVIPFVKSADISLVPIQNVCLSYYYCLPNKLLESTMALLPVVVSDFPELRRFVEISGSGVVMHEADPADIARAIREAYENRDRLRPTSEKLELAEEIYGWPKQERTLKDLYYELAL